MEHVADEDYHFDVESALLHELGRLLYSAAYLEEISQYVFATLTGEPGGVGETIVAFQRFSWVIERSRWLCGVQFEEGSPLDKHVRSWLARAEAAQNERNRIVHASWFTDATELFASPDQGLLRHGLRRFRRPKKGELVNYEERLIEVGDIRAVAKECESTGRAGLHVVAWLNEEFSRR